MTYFSPPGRYTGEDTNRVVRSLGSNLDNLRGWIISEHEDIDSDIASINSDIADIENDIANLGGGDSSWSAVTFEGESGMGGSTPWSNYGSSFHDAEYRKLSSGLVEIRGLIRDGDYGMDIFTLPSGYRPAARLIFRCQSAGGGSRVDVKSGGEVFVSSSASDGGTWISLSGISFYADQ